MCLELVKKKAGNCDGLEGGREGTEFYQGNEFWKRDIEENLMQKGKIGEILGR